MPAPVVLILAAGRGERFLASGGNTHKCIGWRQSPEVAPYRWPFEENGRTFDRKRLVRTVLIFTESSDQLSRATDRVPGLPANPGYVQ